MPKKILIIDDEKDIIDFLSQLFQDIGYETVVARDGVEGQEVLERENPDLITLDLQMPKDTGTDFYRHVHRNKKFKDIPVIVISGIAGRHLAISKPLAVFDKPIDKDRLISIVTEALN